MPGPEENGSTISARKFSAQVQTLIRQEYDDRLTIIAPSGEFIGTCEGYWTCKGSLSGADVLCEWAICERQGDFFLFVRLPVAGGQGREAQSIHVSPRTAAERVCGFIDAMALVQKLFFAEAVFIETSGPET